MAQNRFPNSDYHRPNCEWLLDRLKGAIEILEQPEGIVPAFVKGPYYEFIIESPSTVWADWNLDEVLETYNTLNDIPRDQALAWAKATYGRLYHQYIGDQSYSPEKYAAPSQAPYELPQATFDTLGGVKAMERGPEDTQLVNIDPETGLLYTEPGGGGTGAGHIVSDTPPEDTELLWVDPHDNTGSEAPVISVNKKTGIVELNASDIPYSIFNRPGVKNQSDFNDGIDTDIETIYADLNAKANLDDIPPVYTLPIAGEKLGGVKGPTPTAEQTETAGIDENGNIKYKAGGDTDGGTWELIETVQGSGASVFRQYEPNGTEYNFKSLYLEIQTGNSDADLYGNISVSTRNKFEVAILRFESPPGINKVYGAGFIDDRGALKVYSTDPAQLTDDGKYIRTAKVNLNPHKALINEPINKFNTTLYLSVGATMKIWAVRA